MSDITFNEDGQPLTVQLEPSQRGGREALRFTPSQIGWKGGTGRPGTGGTRISSTIADRVAQFEKLSEVGSISGMAFGSVGCFQRGADANLTAHARAFISSIMDPGEHDYNPQHNTNDFGQTGGQVIYRAKQNIRYDVLAPPGAIGIVVDTTKDGPCVHSLKPTSPLLGLITPGDLIIALDGQDTSGMTAATLTRLMAQKSMQRERKITLLTGGD